jgi:hypothetical protein
MGNRDNPASDKLESTLPPDRSRINNVLDDFYNYGLSTNQIRIHNGEFLHNIGLRGQNMVIGMLDAGYYQYTTLKAFDSVNKNGQVLGTYDFVNRETSVIEDNAHGMYCFSIIAANIPGQFVGSAPKANFYLYRSEDAASEYPIEEHNWVCAAERVDSVGGDIISSSLGYTTFDNPAFNHTYADMNGNTTMAAIGADLAAKKGILVFNAAGNDGASTWKFIGTPADADSIVAVGAVTTTGAVANFSSFGPSSDGQIKPDVASVGVATVLQATNNTISTGNGTSYACPNMAGLATCLWQGFREFNNMKIISVLRQAGSTAAAPDNRIGYGIPDMKKAVLILLKEYATSTLQLDGCRPSLQWTSKDATGMKYEIERKAPGESVYMKVGEVKSREGLFEARSYQFSDPTAFAQAGIASYRIRQLVDTNSTTLAADYIDTATVSVNIVCTINQVAVTPNPVTGPQFQLQVTYPEAIPQLYIRVTNAIGQEVYSRNYNKPTGPVSITIPAVQLAIGKYFITIYNQKEKLGTQEFIKLR